MRAVHSIRDVATGELRGHRLLSREWYGLVLLGEEKADLNTVIPRLVCVVVRKDTRRLWFECSNGFLDKGLVRHIRVEDLTSIARGDEIALQ